MEFNTVAIVLLVALLTLWNLDFITSLLNIKSLKPQVPDEFRGIYDEEKYAKSQEYTRASARFEIISSTISLVGFLLFWILGGFEQVDG